MPSAAASFDVAESPAQRLERLFAELSELTGQRNAIDGRIVEIVAEMDRDELCGATGARSMKALVAWKTGVTPRNAEVVLAISRRLEEFPRCAQGMREGRLSLDQVGVIAEKAADGSDEHYAELAAVATVHQLRTAVKLEPRPEPDVRPEPERAITKTVDDGYTTYRIRLPRIEAAKFDAAMQAHHDGLIADWKRDHDTESDGGDAEQTSPFPNGVDAFMSLVEAGWDVEAARRPHGQHTTVVVHVDLDADGQKPVAALHLGPVLTEDERGELLCDGTWEAWFERHGQVIGAGRSTRQISRRLRRALEHRDRCCVVPGCGATRGLHAHHIKHWEDGGATELDNLVLVCPYHHRLHHRRLITITGPADRLVVTDSAGRPLHGGSLARTPTTPPPDVPPCPGPTGERAEWWWYPPFQPQPPPKAA
ncbi:HNH endonuclease signature motif containing protein [Mycolicibacterium septicum]|uniref:HNH endonuclease signature motif containing protein n=1 Tax=Mycolicibacterium septicum TaxID=98668 RepID=UPI0023E242C3|nr:HNH endonuclease signature motif containing protein [Mycolicibacterium septicum]MDF3340691.1 HNH endonuclease signature motif containing protein [Mycolicibacterium septicum]